MAFPFSSWRRTVTIDDGLLRKEARVISPGRGCNVFCGKILNFKNIAFKILGAVAASLSFASLGAGIGVTSVLIYSLGTSTDPYIELTLELASWIRKNGS